MVIYFHELALLARLARSNKCSALLFGFAIASLRKRMMKISKDAALFLWRFVAKCTWFANIQKKAFSELALLVVVQFCFKKSFIEHESGLSKTGFFRRPCLLNHSNNRMQRINE